MFGLQIVPSLRNLSHRLLQTEKTSGVFDDRRIKTYKEETKTFK